MKLDGYASAAYAESLLEFGTPRLLPRCQGWVLERLIPGLAYRDAIGCYPLFRCGDWSKLSADLDDLDNELVSITMVPDPLADLDEAGLRACFPDLVTPFKRHFVADMQRSIDEIVSRHHRKYARKALKEIDTELCPQPENFLDEWIPLHENLVSRHAISGIRAYSRRAFEKQLSVPGIVVLKALHRGLTVGAQLWFVHDDVAFGHVQAFTAAGYELGASYALYWTALNHFSGKVRWCNFGGIAGMRDDDDSKLSQFKAGWSTDRRIAYLCGRILNRERYRELAATNPGESGFFPAYRTRL